MNRSPRSSPRPLAASFVAVLAWDSPRAATMTTTPTTRRRHRGRRRRHRRHRRPQPTTRRDGRRSRRPATPSTPSTGERRHGEVGTATERVRRRRRRSDRPRRRRDGRLRRRRPRRRHRHRPDRGSGVTARGVRRHRVARRGRPGDRRPTGRRCSPTSPACGDLVERVRRQQRMQRRGAGRLRRRRTSTNDQMAELLVTQFSTFTPSEELDARPPARRRLHRRPDADRR